MERISLRAALMVALLLFCCCLFGQQRSTPPPAPHLMHIHGGTTMASAAGVAPWSLSDRERVNARVSTDQMDRVRALSATANQNQDHFNEDFDGRAHPELFMSFELFDRLLSGLSSDSRRQTNAHAIYDDHIRAFGYDSVEKFWGTLSFAAGSYLELVAASGGRSGSTVFTIGGRSVPVPISQEKCAARIAALETARGLLGGKEFDRFLYTVVAAQAGHSSNGNISATDRADQLMYMAGACK